MGKEATESQVRAPTGHRLHDCCASMIWHLFVTAAALAFWGNCEVMRDAYRNGPVSMNACGDDNAKEE